MEKKYIPRELDKRWLQGTLNMLKDGGTWGWPNAGIVYLINKKDQIAKMVRGDANSFEAHMGEVVFESIGWTVEIMEGQAKVPNGDGRVWAGSAK